ncbi:ankyrin repeat domain-containing protein [Stenotrophomonas maltophilia]|uniref:ankyrin repeat domain-containing protein n=1 Tax=Stenotrophomonas maltophilia TaxID=40324 RepID=UPI0009AD4C36|nr:ankyrin repeat domain-containing protein [Stenotrophomonas maltophilia]MBA0541557.1 ankyrin repeat domain-containing protein [Stenotrophomonas maltophilia]MBH1742640.1 ankyrin repeat domain-containing protein [Stenotrophomonas maltophilia]MBY8924069.1 ankyrin repeat domain-containing protein [Stenotrophomonas maltophilia]PJL13829.1 hypothetical protein B9Y71_22085 [Stenotrophomonas maltophilia]
MVVIQRQASWSAAASEAKPSHRSPNAASPCPESQAIYDVSRAGSRFDHLIDHALHLARIRGDKEQLFYASEADDTLPGTALIDVVANGRWNEARGLIRSHVDVNATNSDGQTALHLAGDPGVIHALLRFGAKQDIVDDFGNTPIQAAIERGDSDAQHLMEKYLHRYKSAHDPMPVNLPKVGMSKPT